MIVRTLILIFSLITLTTSLLNAQTVDCAQVTIQLLDAGEPNKFTLVVDSDKPFSNLQWVVGSDNIFPWNIDSGTRWDYTGTHAEIPLTLPFNSTFNVSARPGYVGENYTYCIQPWTRIKKTITELPRCASSIEAKLLARGKYEFSYNGWDVFSPGSTQHWDFGDGTTSSSGTITHQYNVDGTYEVTFTRTFGESCSSVTKHTVVVGCDHVEARLIPEKADSPGFFNFSTTTTQQWKNASFDHGEPGALPSTTSGHKYARNGTYTVTYTAQTVGGCSVSAQSTINVTDAHLCGSPTLKVVPTQQPGLFHYIVDSDLHIQSTNINIFGIDQKWSFSSGTRWDYNGKHLDLTPHTITRNGPAWAYVNLQYEFAPGKFCFRDIYDTLMVTGNPCSATIVASPVNQKTYAFKLTGNNIGTKGIAINSWDFGDGNTSTEFDPRHTYESAGTYKVKVSTTAYGCTAVTEKEIIVCINGETPLVIEATGAPREYRFTITAPLKIQYVYWGIDDGKKLLWDDFDFNPTSLSVSGTYAFEKNGTYNIYGMFVTETGCRGEGSFTVEVTDPEVECEEGTTEITMLSVPGSEKGEHIFMVTTSTPVTYYNWVIQKGEDVVWSASGETNTTETRTAYTFTENGTYTIRGEFITGYLCSYFATTTITISEFPPPVIQTPTEEPPPPLPQQPQPEVVTGVDVSEDHNIIYPNPSDGHIFFSRPTSGGVYNMQGMLLHSLNDTKEADLTGIGAGLYLLKTQEGYVTKIMIR